MQIGLKDNVMQIVATLKASKKQRLAECIEKNWNKTAFAYSKELNFWRPKKPMEKELLYAFGKELDRLEIKEIEKKEILRSINKRRVLQTAPHLGATETPRMLCINWLGSLAVPAKDFYIAAMFSGVPFSNRSRPGRINRKKDSINLFPSTLQDGLVYRSIVPAKLAEAGDSLPDEIYRFLPRAIKGESYTKWALSACQHIERKILKKNNLVFLDINEVVSEYLVKVLSNRFHVFHKIFFNPKWRKEFAEAFPGEIMFYTPVMDGKYEQMENMTLIGDNLKSRSRIIDLHNKEAVVKELEDGRLCPGLLISFLALAFLNQFKCFGSFAQVEYLPVYQEKLAKLSFMKPFKIEKVPTSNLTTGMFKDNPYPADIISSEKFKPEANTLFGELLLSMKDVLLESYFTGDVRKK